MTWKEVLQIRDVKKAMEAEKQMLAERGMTWWQFMETEEYQEVAREAARLRFTSPYLYTPKNTTDETNQTMIPRNAAWQCVHCKKHIPFTVTCTAYPKWIPEEITFGEKMCTEREEKQGK